MGGQLVMRPRRRRTRRPVWVAGPPVAVSSHPGWEQPPHLSLVDPDDPRHRRISAALSVGLHLAILTGLIGAAWLAPPEIMEKIIRVALIRPAAPVELPGTNAEPAPAAPKVIGARRSVSAAALAARTMTPEQAEALRRAALEAARRALEQMELDSVQKPVLPTQVKRREVQADRVAARAAAAVLPTAALDISDIEPIAIDPARLEALTLELEAPQQIDTASLPELSTADALAVLDQMTRGDYTGGVAAVTWEPGTGLPGAGQGGGGLDTGVGGALGGEGGFGVAPGSGGTGHVVGAVRCLESAHVQRYLQMMQSRTQQRWTIPAGIDPNARVVLRFGLDAAGMASEVETVDLSDDTLGQSAMQALRAAAPFPPMTDANRCLSEKRIVLTFTVPRT